MGTAWRISARRTRFSRPTFVAVSEGGGWSGKHCVVTDCTQTAPFLPGVGYNRADRDEKTVWSLEEGLGRCCQRSPSPFCFVRTHRCRSHAAGARFGHFPTGAPTRHRELPVRRLGPPPRLVAVAVWPPPPRSPPFVSFHC